MEKKVHTIRIKYLNKTSSDSFSVREDRKHIWLQKIAVGILQKLNCYSKYSERQCVAKTYRMEGVAEYIFKSHIEIMTHRPQFGREDIVIYMGKDEYGKFMDEQVETLMRYPAGLELRERGRAWFQGMEIILVPYWDGILVAPRPESMTNY